MLMSPLEDEAMNSCDGSNSTLWHLARFPRLRLGRRDREVAQFAGLGIHAERLQGAADWFHNVEDAVARKQVEVTAMITLAVYGIKDCLTKIPAVFACWIVAQRPR